ncbi:calcium-binding protein [Microcoleus sp. Pol11C1]|uniref:calcium-binding protein n=1 Tax=unclassified Microcoleus TaxID=2642155 RepID=UPI002FCFBE31
MAIFKGTRGNDYYDHKGTGFINAEGKEGNDTIFGNTKNDIISGDSGKDKLYGWTGNDALYGDEGDDWMSGGDGNDVLFGGTNNDTILGGNGNDTINGSGNISLYNSNEYDVLNGGNGNDTFVVGGELKNYYQGVGHAIIQDYNSANDYIQLKGSASSFRLDKTRNLAGGAGIDTQIYSGNDLLAIVQDTTNLQLTSHYFKFV